LFILYFPHRFYTETSHNANAAFSKLSLFRSNAPMQLLNIILVTDVLTKLKRGSSVNLVSDCEYSQLF